MSSESQLSSSLSPDEEVAFYTLQPFSLMVTEVPLPPNPQPADAAHAVPEEYQGKSDTCSPSQIIISL